MRFSLEPGDQIFVKGYGFCLLLKIWVKVLAKNINENVSGKCSQKRLH